MECFANSGDCCDEHVEFSCFDAAHIAGIYFNQFRQPFLCHTLGHANAAHVSAQLPEIGCNFALGHATFGRIFEVDLKGATRPNLVCSKVLRANQKTETKGKSLMNKPVKTIVRLIVGCVLACCLLTNASAQTQPRLKIARNSTSSVQVNWTNQVGTSYHVFFSTNLTKPFTLLEDAFSPDALVTVYASTTDTPLGFFRIQVPTNSSTATVQIFSPSNSLTVSGEISVRMGAQLGTQVQGVNLYLDDALVGYLNSGGMNFSLDTTHFANGQHTVYVGAVDTANNETLSSSITLDFENPVRWLDACSLFNYFVPIDVDSDIFPADWLVSVTDTNGTVVRTITGSTTDGIIQTSWDGTDDIGQPLPVENLYLITVDVNATGGAAPMMASSLASALSATAVSLKRNLHGVPEYVVQKPAPNPLTGYLETLKFYSQIPPKIKLIYPPLPPRPADNPNATTLVKMSAREMFLAVHKSAGSTPNTAVGTATLNPSPTSGSGSTRTWLWFENPWNSGQTVLARVPILGAFGTVVQNFFLQIRDLIELATGTVGNGRRVYGPNAIYVLQNSGDLSALTNNLANSSAHAFYFYGHGNTDGNMFGIPGAGIRAQDLSSLLGNYYVPVLPASYGRDAGNPAIFTHHPYSFVFLDGCNTALGDLPEAFGIPKHIAGARLNDLGLHKRAFLGWTGTVLFQFDNDHFAWTQKFWSTWLDGNNYDTTIIRAKQDADAYRPSVLNNVPIKLYGNTSLKWND